MMTDKEQIFSILCNHYCSAMDGWVPYPSTIIHKHMSHLSLYKVRKLLKELKSEGLIDSSIYVETGDDLDRPILVRGYEITKKALDTPEYERAWEAERELCKKCFEFDIGPVRKEEEDEWIDL